MADMTAVQIKLALLYKKQEIVDLLSKKVPPLDLRLGLWKCGVLTNNESSSLGDTCDLEGPLGQARQLVDIVLTREEQLQTFLDKLETLCIEAYSILLDNPDVLDKIGEHIKEVYKQINYHLVKTLPGEDFHIDLTKPEYMMPMEFHTQRLEQLSRQADVLPSKKIRHKYNSAKFDSIFDIMQKLPDSDASSVMCLGVAGSGKSIMLKNIMCSWLKNDPQMHGFHLVMVIPLRDVDVNKPLVDILYQVGKTILDQAGKTNKMITDELKSALEFVLVEPSADVLLLFDGIDEVEVSQDSDLYKIITGEKYSNIKKVFTARPEAQLLSTLDNENVYQDFQVDVKGTTSEGIKKYLRAIIMSSSHDTEANADVVDILVEEIINKCRQNMQEYELLKIPLYLTLMGYLFNKHYAEYCSFADFTIPRSATNLYNACMKVLLKIWLKRLNNLDEFSFDSDPLAIASTVPDDIKRQVFMIGKMSYDFLRDKKYNFSCDDVRKYFISEGDVIVSGLFNVSQNDGGFHCFFSHRTLQEYMASLYLSKVQFGEHSFTRILENSIQEQNILSLFPNLPTVLRFVFGINPSFASEIIKRLGPHIGIIKFISDLDNSDMNTESDENDKDDNFHQEYVEDRIDLTYEAALFSEIDNPHLKATFLEFLSTCIMVETGSFHDKNLDQIFVLCQEFSKIQRIQILKSWFGLDVEEENGCSVISNLVKVYDHQKLVESYSEPIDTELRDQGYHLDYMDDEPSQEHLKYKLHVQELWHVLYYLLSPMTFPNILTLDIDKSHISNVNLILRIFPSIKYLSIGGIDVSLGYTDDFGRDEEFIGTLLRHGTPDSCWPFEDEQPDDLTSEEVASSKHAATSLVPSNLTHLTLKASHEEISEESIIALQNQKQLESLRISSVDIFSKDIELSSWKHLNTLELYMHDLDNEQEIDAMSSLVGKYISNIKSLTLGTGNIYSEIWKKWSNNILGHLTKDPPLELKLLRLFEVLDDEGITKLCELLPNLKALETLGLSSEDVSDPGNFVDVVKQCPNITQFHVGYMQEAEYPEGDNPITVARNLATSLGIATNWRVKVEMYEFMHFEIVNQDDLQEDQSGGNRIDDRLAVTLIRK